MRISFAWWNTSLSPAAKPGRAGPIDKTIALGVISDLLLRKNVSILGLCELSEHEIEGLRDLATPHGYLLINGATKVGKTSFDTCVIYHAEIFEKLGFKNIDLVRDRQTQKIAQHVIFKVRGKRQRMHVLISHWPSVMLRNTNTPIRLVYGEQLRIVVESIWKKSKNALIVLMGDFNDEPFSEPLAFSLGATRDRGIFKSDTQRLYNPFWRRLGSVNDYSHGNDLEHFAGTHIYHADTIDRWRTFDQIIFSSGFLGPSRWHLDEASVGVVDIPSYTSQVLSKKSIFDHLPVMATIEQVN